MSTPNREYLVIECLRTGYNPTQINQTMTVKDLREFLDEFPDDMIVVTSHDNGYTFGPIRDCDFYTEYEEDRERVEE